MKINTVGLHNINVGFKSIRADKEKIAQLAIGQKPIIENNKRNIYAALNNISKEPTYANIDFLLQVADNLAYGQGRNSVFKDTLDKGKITPADRENTDWMSLLEDTIKKAISESKDDDVADLGYDYKRIFTDKKELTPEQ